MTTLLSHAFGTESPVVMPRATARWGSSGGLYSALRPITAVAASLVIAVATAAIPQAVTAAHAGGALGSQLGLAASVVAAAIALLAYAGFVRVLERRPVTELSRSGIGRELGSGLLLGASCSR